MITTIITFVIPIVISLILYFFTKKKWIIVAVCCVLMTMSCFFIYQDRINQREYEEFYLPFLDYPISYNMTRADILYLIESNYEITGGEYENSITIVKEWFDVLNWCYFIFDDSNKLEAVAWGQIDEGNYSLSVDQYEKLHEDVLKYLNSCYGSEKYSKTDGAYYWENTYHYKVTHIYGTDFLFVFWFRPDMKTLSIPIKI